MPIVRQLPFSGEVDRQNMVAGVSPSDHWHLKIKVGAGLHIDSGADHIVGAYDKLTFHEYNRLVTSRQGHFRPYLLVDFRVVIKCTGIGAGRPGVHDGMGGCPHGAGKLIHA